MAVGQNLDEAMAHNRFLPQNRSTQKCSVWSGFRESNLIARSSGDPHAKRTDNATNTFGTVRATLLKDFSRQLWGDEIAAFERLHS